MKYIVLQVVLGEGNTKIIKELPIIFPGMLIHEDTARLVKQNLNRKHNINSSRIKIVSAGECNFFGNVPNCGGSSDSLKLESRKEVDDELISMYNYTHGIIWSSIE